MRLATRSALIFVVVAGHAGPVVSAEPTMEQIVAALRQRERSHPAGRIEWADRSYFRAVLLQPGIDDPAHASDDVRATTTRVFAWEGTRMSYRFEGQIFNRRLAKAVPIKYANVCGDEREGRSLRVLDSARHPIGRISTSTHLESREDTDLIPILLWLRPLSRLCFGIDPQGCRVRADRGPIKGRECLILERSRGVTDRWYIDPAPNWQILRYEVLSGGKARVRIDLNYSSDEKGDRLLRAWQTRTWSGGNDQANTVTMGVVTDQKAAGRPPAKEFELDFPHGTWVHDDVRGREYVIEGDGSERLVPGEEMERRATSEDQPQAEPDAKR